jgi:penicillin-binding protein-related factor A (putative recombinase)
MTEANLWKWLSKVKKHYKEDLHLTRLENLVGNGTPDVEGCLCGRQFWIELKCIPKRTNSLLRIRFQPSQIPWMQRRQRAGGHVFVLLQVGSAGQAHRYLLNLELFEGKLLYEDEIQNYFVESQIDVLERAAYG